MKVSELQFATIREHIEERLADYVNDPDEIDSGKIEFDFIVCDGLTFMATIHVNTLSTESIGGSYGGYCFEYITTVEITSYHLACGHWFGVFDEDENCCLSEKQKASLTVHLNG